MKGKSNFKNQRLLTVINKSIKVHIIQSLIFNYKLTCTLRVGEQ